jgi:Pyrimidine dimer DNA glycosylase
MRLWSIHPAYLDSKGLLALWREALLAQKVLLGETKGYKNHPQLIRFKNTQNPVGAIAEYLRWIVDEADKRGYKFDKEKIAHEEFKGRITVTEGQVNYEFTHLSRKLKKRALDLYIQLGRVKKINLHPMFKQVSGNIESWEIT